MTHHKHTDVVLISVENGILPSCSMLSLDSYLNKEGIRAEILYPLVTRDSLHSLVNKIFTLKPLVVGIGGMFDDRFVIKRIIDALKPYRKNFRIIVGGNAVTPIPEFMVKKLSADAGVVGEGEIIFVELVKKIIGDEDFSNVKGVVFEKEGKMLNTGPGEYVKNLNELPPFNYEKVPMDYFINVYKFYKNITRNNIFTPSCRLGAIFAGRGCKYKCNFCYHPNPIRLLSVSNIIIQVKELKERFNINMVDFADDLTLINKKRCLELCKALMEENLQLPYIANAHLNCLDEEMVISLKESGCTQLTLGLESGSQQVLDRINKQLQVEQIRNGIELLRKYRINWSGVVQVGQLNETEEDIKKSKDLFYPYIDELATISVCFTTPYPGTPLYHYGLKSGLIKNNEEFFEKFANVQNLVFNFSKLCNRRLRYLRIKLAFIFDFRKQQKLRGIWGAILFLLYMYILKIKVRMRDKFFHYGI